MVNRETTSEKRRLNLAVVIKRFVTTGGAERYAVETTRYLTRQGHRVALYARQVQTGTADGLTFYPVPERWRFSSVVNSLAFALDAARMLAGRRYDAVISHERGFSQDLAVIHTFSYRNSLARLGWLKRLDRLYFSPRTWLHLYLEKHQMHSPQLVAVSQPIRQEIAALYGRQSGIQVVFPGVNLERFAPESTAACGQEQRLRIGAGTNELLVLFVGTEFRRKGLDDLLSAIGDGIRLAVVGKGERLGHYRRRIRELDLEGQVYFAGLVDDVRPWYAAADVVVLPSRAEAFGMSVLEAMACARAVVVRRRAGVSELIESGRNGYVFEDPAELGPLLVRLTDPELRRRLGEGARRTALSHGWEVAGAALERLCYGFASRFSP